MDAARSNRGRICGAGRAIISLDVARRSHREVGLLDHAQAGRVADVVIQPAVAVVHRLRRDGQRLVGAHVPRVVALRPGGRGVASLDSAHGDGGRGGGVGGAVVQLGVGGRRHGQVRSGDRHRAGCAIQRVVGRHRATQCQPGGAKDSYRRPDIPAGQRSAPR